MAKIRALYKSQISLVSNFGLRRKIFEEIRINAWVFFVSMRTNFTWGLVLKVPTLLGNFSSVIISRNRSAISKKKKRE